MFPALPDLQVNSGRKESSVDYASQVPGRGEGQLLWSGWVSNPKFQENTNFYEHMDFFVTGFLYTFYNFHIIRFLIFSFLLPSSPTTMLFWPWALNFLLFFF